MAAAARGVVTCAAGALDGSIAGGFEGFGRSGGERIRVGSLVFVGRRGWGCCYGRSGRGTGWAQSEVNQGNGDFRRPGICRQMSAQVAQFARGPNSVITQDMCERGRGSAAIFSVLPCLTDTVQCSVTRRPGPFSPATLISTHCSYFHLSSDGCSCPDATVAVVGPGGSAAGQFYWLAILLWSRGLQRRFTGNFSWFSQEEFQASVN